MTSSLWLVAGIVAFVLLILLLGVITALMNRLHPERGRSGRRRYSGRGEREWRDEGRGERRYGDEYRRRDEREYEEQEHKERREHREYQEYSPHRHRRPER